MIDSFRIDSGFGRITNDLAGAENKVIGVERQIAAPVNESR